MYSRTIIIAIACSLLALPALAGQSLAGKTFQVDVVTIGDTRFVSSCVSFHKDGRFTFDRNALSMTWAQPYDQPDTFVAVTSGTDPTLIPYKLAAHGLVISGELVIGTTVDQYGNSTGFIGTEVVKCDTEKSASTSTGSCLRVALASGNKPEQALANCTPAPYLQAIAQLYAPSVAPCVNEHCDPSLNPLRAGIDWLGQSRLRNRHFMVSMSDVRAPAACWSFDQNGQVRTPGRSDMVWAPDFLYDVRSTFQAISDGGVGKAYYGSLIDDSVLEVRGIEASARSSRTVYGIGRETKSCANR